MENVITETCWNCKGSGILVFNNVLLGMIQPSGLPKSYLVQCRTCGGTGKVSYIPRTKKENKKKNK